VAANAELEQVREGGLLPLPEGVQTNGGKPPFLTCSIRLTA